MTSSLNNQPKANRRQGLTSPLSMRLGGDFTKIAVSTSSPRDMWALWEDYTSALEIIICIISHYHNNRCNHSNHNDIIANFPAWKDLCLGCGGPWGVQCQRQEVWLPTAKPQTLNITCSNTLLTGLLSNAASLLCAKPQLTAPPPPHAACLTHILPQSGSSKRTVPSHQKAEPYFDWWRTFHDCA